MRLRTRLGDAALLLGAAAIAGFAARRGINPHDEGLMLAAADRIADGQLPWRDFWWNYGPAEPFLLSGLHEVVGRSLLAWRIVHVLVAAVGAWLGYRLVRREAPAPLALAAWLTIVAALSFPLIPNPIVPAFVLALTGLFFAPRHAALAGVCAGLALAFRVDVGAAAVLAVALAAWRPTDAGTATGARPSRPRAGAAATALPSTPGTQATASRSDAATRARPSTLGPRAPAPRADAATTAQPPTPGKRSLASRAAAATSPQPSATGPSDLTNDARHPRLGSSRTRIAAKTAAVRTLIGAAAGALLVYVPLAIAAGPGRLLDQTVGFALSEQSRQRLPLPFDGGGTGDLNKAFEHLFPTLVLAGFALWLAVVGVRWARGGGPPPGLELQALPLAVAGALYVLARADEFHVVLLAATLPLVAAPTLAAALAEPRRPWPAIVATAAVLALPLLYGLDRKGVQLLHPPQLATIDLPVADGVQAEPRETRALAALARYVARTTAPGDPVFVANPRHDLVRVGNPLVSFVIDRPNPTGYPIMQPGVVTERAVQEEMVRDIRRAGTRVVVRWRSPVADEREPNGAGRSSGVHVLDRYLKRDFRPVRRFGDYELLSSRFES